MYSRRNALTIQDQLLTQKEGYKRLRWNAFKNVVLSNEDKLAYFIVGGQNQSSPAPLYVDKYVCASGPQHHTIIQNY